MNDEYYMKMALALAVKGQGYTSPNPMVGAVVVHKDNVVGRGYHKTAGGPHAEVNAIDEAGSYAKDGTIYVNLEPCNHTGRTPPCTEKIIASGIKRVVIGTVDPNPDVKGGGIEYLKRKKVAVTTGVCEDEAKKLNETFIKYIQTKRPFVTVKCAATLDGQIATRTGDSKWITGPESRRFVHRLRHAADAIMVGIETVRKDDPSLTARLTEKKGRDPIRIILDTRLSICESAKLLHLESDSDTIVVTGDFESDADFEKKKAFLEKSGVRIIPSPLKNNRIDLDALMDRLGMLGVTSILIEGGGSVIASALQDGVVEKIIFFYAPKILGGNDGISICKGSGPARIGDCIKVRDISVKRLEDDIVVTGYI